MALHGRAAAGPVVDCSDYFLNDGSQSAQRMKMAEEPMYRAGSKKQSARVRAGYFEKKSHGVEIKK